MDGFLIQLLAYLSNCCYAEFCSLHQAMMTHLETRRRLDVVTRSLWSFQWRLRYFSNETPNGFSVECCEDVSVVRLHDILLERRDDVLRRRNNDLSWVRLHHVSNKSQMKHPMTSQWYVTKTP